MVRPQREDEPGALLHIWTRGVARRSIHEGTTDYDALEERLGHERVQEHMRILAYCLMPNHFHQLAESRDGNVSEAIRWLKQGHARQFNRKRGRDGPLFQGRFRSRRVHGLLGRAALVRYIDRNPVRGGLVTTPAAWHFGSARYYLSASAPEWLATDLVAADVRALTGRELEPRSYARAFHGSESRDMEWLVERTILRPRAFREGWEILDGGDPEFSARWLRRRAELADGLNSSVPLLHPDSLLTALAQVRDREGAWRIRCNGYPRCAWTILTAGLLRDACGLTIDEVAAYSCRELPTTHRELARYRQLLLAEPDFRNRAAELLAGARSRGWPAARTPAGVLQP